MAQLFQDGVPGLHRHRRDAAIILCGLAPGLAASLLLLIYVRSETSYDAWLPNAANVDQPRSPAFTLVIFRRP